jgi:hypothetical protein
MFCLLAKNIGQGTQLMIMTPTWSLHACAYGLMFQRKTVHNTIIANHEIGQLQGLLAPLCI